MMTDNPFKPNQIEIDVAYTEEFILNKVGPYPLGLRRFLHPQLRTYVLSLCDHYHPRTTIGVLR